MKMSRVQVRKVRKKLSKIFSKNLALKTKKVLDFQGLSVGVVKLFSKDGSPCWARTSDIMINSLIAPQHSRLTHFDALLTLNASYSLFRLSPVEKGYSILFLGPSLYRAVGIGTIVKQNIIGLSLTRKKTKASNQMVTRFCLGS